MTSRTRALAVAGAALAVAAAAAPAHAATPESGTLDADALRIDWTGETSGGFVQLAHFFYGEQIVDDCVAPLCDAFTLTFDPVGGKGKIEIGAEDASGYTEMQIKDSAGNEIFWDPGEDEVPTVFRSSSLAAGTYTVEVLTDALGPDPVDDPTYAAYAEYTPPAQ